MKRIPWRKIIDKIFEIAILIKSFAGLFEVLAGVAIALGGKLVINNIIIEFAQQEVAEDPGDIFANFLIKATSDFTAGSYLFAVIYLLFHGAVNLLLVLALMKNKAWGYHWAIVGFSSFAIYQAYRYFHTHSPMLLVLILFDIFFISVIIVEYRRMRLRDKFSN